MPITVKEAINSREWDSQGNCLLRFLVKGTSNDFLALEALLDQIPASVTAPGGTVLLPQEDKPSLVGVHADTIHDVGMWTSEVIYKPPSKLDKPERYGVGSLQLTVDTTGGVKHYVTSQETTHTYSAVQGVTAPSFERAIGVTKDGVEGVDMPMATFPLKAEMIWPLATPPDMAALYLVTGMVNSDAVTITDTVTGIAFTFQAGELLFRGASLGALRGDDGIPVTYSFEASPTATIPTQRMGEIAKKGWEYVWFWVEEYEDAGPPPHVVRRPLYAYVERVLPESAFMDMGIFSEPAAQ